MSEFPNELKNTIFHGDCIDAMKVIPDGSVDIVFTDPPYGIGKEYDGHKDDDRPDEKMWQELFRVTKAEGSLHCTVSNKHLSEWLSIITATGFSYHHTSVYWNQARTGGNWNGQFAYAWEPWLHFTKSNTIKLANRMMSDVFYFTPKKATEHPCERHLATWTKMLRLLPKGIVFDPFMGSGTTALACVAEGFEYYGSEKSDEYFKLIDGRIKELTNQVDMFRGKNGKGEQTEMF